MILDAKFRGYTKPRKAWLVRNRNLQMCLLSFCFLFLFHPNCVPSARIIFFILIFGLLGGITNNPLYRISITIFSLNICMLMDFANSKHCHGEFFFFFGALFILTNIQAYFYTDCVFSFFFMMTQVLLYYNKIYIEV